MTPELEDFLRQYIEPDPKAELYRSEDAMQRHTRRIDAMMQRVFRKAWTVWASRNSNRKGPGKPPRGCLV
jgi:hypothetical protein